MKLCGDHWQALKEQIEAVGLRKFVAPNGEAVAKQMTDPDPEKPWDPLAHAVIAIYIAAINSVGPGILMEAEATCPLCMGDKEVPGLAKNWIEGACRDELEDFQKKGWLPKETVQ